MRIRAVLCLLTTLAIASCSSSKTPAPDPLTATPAPIGTSAPSAAKADDETLPNVASPYDALPDSVRSHLDDTFKGDWNELVKRRLIRAGVVFNRSQYFIDRGEQRGFVYESVRLFEEQLNKRLKTGKLPVHVAFVPLQRDQLFPALAAGKVDLVAAGLTITPGREKLVAFSNPTRTGVSEIVVTSKDGPPLNSADDLSGREIFIRKSSAYNEAVGELNQRLKSHGKAPVTIRPAPESLEDDDILEMVNAGLVSATIVDDYVARFWQQVFGKLQLHEKAAVRRNGTLAVGVRKSNPMLLKAINIWIKEYGPRTRFGNVVNNRYLENVAYVKSANDEAERKKFQTLVGYFRKYSDQYKLDYLLMAAQGYQESQLNQQAKSAVGAIGVMQVMPATGADLKVGDIQQVEPNIHAGIKYMRFMVDQYYKDDPMDDMNKALMTLASYNAGPGRMRTLRKEAAKKGLDPNVWFGNVERVASERVGRETVQYVGNIYKYYVAYRLAVEQAERKAAAKTGS